MSTVRISHYGLELSFSDSDVVNPKDHDPDYGTKPWLLHDHGFPVALVFAENLQDALDIAADNDKLDGYLIAEEDHDDYKINSDEPTCAFLGNYCKPYDIDTLGYVELRNPPFSFCALFDAQEEKDRTSVNYHFT